MLKFYTGPERRQHCRRQTLDRRDLLRWQLEQDERRALEGRRQGDASKSLA